MAMRWSRRQFVKLLGVGTAAMAGARAARAAAGPDLAQDNDRPEYHFLAPRYWMNDPNGPIWWKGRYHLFYQWSALAMSGVPVHWGHAVSQDMVHWRHLPYALAPAPGGADRDGCWTGSAVVHDGVPTVIYTGVIHQPGAANHDHEWRQAQMLATAEDDELLKWKKREKPVIAGPPEGMKATGFRDPCPWREEDGWYLGVGSGERDKGGCVLLYRSQDLRAWEYLHPLVHGKRTGNPAPDSVDRGDMWECPDFFEVDGRHCLLYSSENVVTWATGAYDRKQHRFTMERTGLVDRGGLAYYAPKSFRAPDGRRILWGWVREMRSAAAYDAAGWAGATSLPRVLTIDADGRLCATVAAEVEKLRGAREEWTVKEGAPAKRRLAALRQELQVRAARRATVRLRKGGAPAWEMTLDAEAGTVRCGETSFAAAGPELRIFFDGSVIEAFVGGREAMTCRVYGLKPGETELEVAAAGAAAVSLWELDAISRDRLTSGG